MGSKKKEKNKKRQKTEEEQPTPTVPNAGAGTGNGNGSGNNSVITDARFASSQKDPRFQDFPKHKTKVSIDSRFNRMFTDKNFSTSTARVDKRGKARSDASSQNPLKHYYRLNEDEEEEKRGEELRLKKVDRKISDSESESSSELESEEDGDDVESDDGALTSTSTDSDEEEEGVYSEEEENPLQEENVPEIDKETRRLAVVNLDWTQVKAIDLYVLLSSFLPKGGNIFSVAIYPSEFGLKRIEEEAVRGPVALFDDDKGKNENNDDDDDNDEDNDEEIDNEKMRAYELSRLRYYFAVVECDSVATADYLYKTCDGVEFERSSNKLDLRFIPDSMEFKHAPRDVATQAPNTYEGIDFHTQALQHSNIRLTWDEDEPQRSRTLKRKFSGEEKAEEELKVFLASDESETDQDETDSDNGDEYGKRHKIEDKYRALLHFGDGSDGDDEEDGQDMEVTFNTGLEDISKKILEKKDKKSETVWEAYLRKRREKKNAGKKRSKVSSEDESGDTDREPIEGPDDFFVEEPPAKVNEAHGKSARKQKQILETDKEGEASRAELELLFAEDEEADTKMKGYNLKRKKAKGKKGREVLDEEKIPTVDYDDSRFSSLFTSPLFALDPTDPQFKRSAAYARQVAQKQQKGDLEESRRREHVELPRSGQARISKDVGTGKDETLQSDNLASKNDKHEISMLLKSVKMKSKQVPLPSNGKISGR